MARSTILIPLKLDAPENSVQLFFFLLDTARRKKDRINYVTKFTILSCKVVNIDCLVQKQHITETSRTTLCLICRIALSRR